jgi:ubiquinone/menaquinone biosynthesis C-methylase UbiE
MTHESWARKHSRRGGLLLLVCALLGSTTTILFASGTQAQERRRQVRIFPPSELGTLEGPDRELYAKPDQVMDALGIADGSIVAEVGAAGGWFTVRLAKRVGPQGLVYAEDIQEQMIDSIERRIQREGLSNVRTILGKTDDPRLPSNALDSVLIVDTYYEFEKPVDLLRNVKDALKPNGRVAIVEYRKDGVGPGPLMEDRVDESVVIEKAEAAGLRLVSRETFLPYQYMLVFGRRESIVDSTVQARRPAGKDGPTPAATRSNSRVPPTSSPNPPAAPKPPEGARPPGVPPLPNRF